MDTTLSENSKPVIVNILGADRVGKSTLINKIKDSISDGEIKKYKNVSLLHFSGPKPSHNSPIEQYTRPLKDVLTTSPDLILCDRGFSEVCFYEKFRRNMDISEEWALSAESIFTSSSKSTKVFMIKRSWEWSRAFHIKEIKEQFPDCTLYFLYSQLQTREAEHYAYYEYMENYLKHKSQIPYEILQNHNNPQTIYEYIVSV